MRQTINPGRVSYEPNSLGGGCPMQAKANFAGFVSYAEKLGDRKIRGRGEKFFDHFSQATLFYNSQSEPEKAHIVKALRFELGKVETVAIRQRMLYMLSQVDKTLASRVAAGLGIAVPAQLEGPLNKSIPADGEPKDFQPRPLIKEIGASPALSMAKGPKDTIKTRKIAVLAAEGFDDGAFVTLKKAITAAGGQIKVVAPRLGALKGAKGKEVPIDFSLLTAKSVLFDAVYVLGGGALLKDPDAVEFVQDAFKHCKTIGATESAVELLQAAGITTKSGNGEGATEEGVLLSRNNSLEKMIPQFIQSVAQHRVWSRELKLAPTY
jgi:catalase